MSMPMSTCIAQFNSVYSHMLVSHSKDDGEGRDGAVGGGGGCGTGREGCRMDCGKRDPIRGMRRSVGD